MLTFETDYTVIEAAIRAAQNVEFIAHRAHTIFKDVDAPSRWTSYPKLDANAAQMIDILFSSRITMSDKLDNLGILASLSGGEIQYKLHDNESVLIKVQWR